MPVQTSDGEVHDTEAAAYHSWYEKLAATTKSVREAIVPDPNLGTAISMSLLGLQGPKASISPTMFKQLPRVNTTLEGPSGIKAAENMFAEQSPGDLMNMHTGELLSPHEMLPSPANSNVSIQQVSKMQDLQRSKMDAYDKAASAQANRRNFKTIKGGPKEYTLDSWPNPIQ